MLGGKAADAISKAVSVKENNDVGNESKIGVKKEGGSMFKRDEVPLSPLSNLYPYQTAGMMYNQHQDFFPDFPQSGGSGGYNYYSTIKFIDRVGLEHSGREQETLVHVYFVRVPVIWLKIVRKRKRPKGNRLLSLCE